MYKSNIAIFLFIADLSTSYATYFKRKSEPSQTQLDAVL